jgi:Fur family ferric uptake transcriptional regulator
MIKPQGPATAGPMRPRRPDEPARAGGREPWPDLRDELRKRGLRWTPQRRLVLEVLAGTRGHLTGSEIVERCRGRDGEVTPSTVYRTLDVLEDLGYLHHSHGPDGREEFHVLPATEHAHLQCVRCGGTWEMDAAESAPIVERLAAGRGFRVDVGHLTIAGTCAACSGADQA